MRLSLKLDIYLIQLMSLVTKRTVYQLSTVGWMLAVGGSMVLILSGNAEPVVSSGQLPIDGPMQLFGVAAGLIIAGVVVIGQFEKRSWKKAGRRANLAPIERSLIGKPTLEGAVDGHTVRAKTVKRKTGNGGEQGSSHSTFTVVEAELDDHASDGLMLGPTDGSGFDSGSVNVNPTTQVATYEDIAFVGDENLAGEVVTTRVANAIENPDRIGMVFAGDTDGLFSDAMPEPDGFIAGAVTNKMEESVQKRLPGGPGDVSSELSGVLLDPDELEDQIRAVAAVADSFERAVAAPPE